MRVPYHTLSSLYIYISFLYSHLALKQQLPAWSVDITIKLNINENVHEKEASQCKTLGFHINITTAYIDRFEREKHKAQYAHLTYYILQY